MVFKNHLGDIPAATTTCVLQILTWVCLNMTGVTIYPLVKIMFFPSQHLLLTLIFWKCAVCSTFRHTSTIIAKRTETKACSPHWNHIINCLGNAVTDGVEQQ